MPTVYRVTWKKWVMNRQEDKHADFAARPAAESFLMQLRLHEGIEFADIVEVTK